MITLLIKTVVLILWGYLRAFVRFITPRKPKLLRGEVILVTGGSNGIGREILLHLARLETDLTLISWDVDEKGNEVVVRKLRSLGVKRAFGYRVDVSDQLQVKQAADKVQREAGHVTMLFNNAAIAGPLARCWETDLAHARKTHEINFLSHWYTNGEFLPHMIQAGKGHIVATCSMAGFTLGPYAAPYASSKFAMNGYYESLKEDLRGLGPQASGVKVSVIYPAFVATNILASYPVEKAKLFPPPVDAADAAEAIIQAVLRDDQHIYVPGQVRLWHLCASVIPPEVMSVLLDAIDFNTVFATGPCKATKTMVTQNGSDKAEPQRIQSASTG